jgi:hypothetical protein
MGNYKIFDTYEMSPRIKRNIFLLDGIRTYKEFLAIILYEKYKTFSNPFIKNLFSNKEKLHELTNEIEDRIHQLKIPLLKSTYSFKNNCKIISMVSQLLFLMNEKITNHKQIEKIRNLWTNIITNNTTKVDMVNTFESYNYSLPVEFNEILCSEDDIRIYASSESTYIVRLVGGIYLINRQ